MKKLIYIPLIIAYFLQWVFTQFQNLFEVLANGFEEIVLVLENVINKDAKAKPVSKAKDNESE